MPEIAVLNASAIPDDEVAWACKAVDAQLREDFCPHWPDISYHPVRFYATKKDLPSASGLSIIFSIVDAWEDADKAAWHSWAGVPFVQIGAGLGPLSVLLSHEAMEMMVNPRCTRMFVLRDGASAAFEVADPCQAFTYAKRVEMFGEEKEIPVSAFCLPPYFSGASGPTLFAPGSIFDLAPGQLAPGGYLPILGPNGWEPRFGFGTDRDLTAAKAMNPTGRAAMRKAAL